MGMIILIVRKLVSSVFRLIRKTVRFIIFVVLLVLLVSHIDEAKSFCKDYILGLSSDAEYIPENNPLLNKLEEYNEGTTVDDTNSKMENADKNKSGNSKKKKSGDSTKKKSKKNNKNKKSSKNKNKKKSESKN